MSARNQRDRSRRADADTGRPEPDEVDLEPGATGPQPEHRERTLDDPSLDDLSFADHRAIVVRAFKEFMDDHGTMLASALAYSSFLAIPSVLLVAVGAFTLLAGPATIASLMQHLGGVMPGQATSLLGSSLRRLSSNPSSGIAMTAVGFVIALWSTTGAMTSFMTAINIAYDREDSRSFVKKRLVAVAMVGVIGVAFLLVAVFLIFGPTIERAISSHVGAAGSVVTWVWWIAQWPILIGGLLAAFATLLYLGPDADHPRWKFLTLGSAFAVVVWLVASGAFAVYTSRFGSYNKTWGSLAAVIVMLTWLWLAGIALLLGAEINAEAERSRELRAGRPAERELQVARRG